MGAKAELLCCTLIGAGLKADEPPIKAADNRATSFMVLKFIGVKRAVVCYCYVILQWSAAVPQIYDVSLTRILPLHKIRFLQ